MQNLQSLQKTQSLTGRSYNTVLEPMYSLVFGGVDGRVAVNDNAFDGLAAGTIECFIKTSYTGAYQKFIFKSGCLDIGIQNLGDGNKVFAEITGVSNIGTFGDAISDGNWHHFALSWDGSFLRAYIDGVFKKKQAQSGTQADTAGTLYLGRRDTTEPMNGMMDEVRFSNIARYTTETSFAVPTLKFANDVNTLVLLHFNEGTGTTATDSSSNSNTGTLSGGVTWSTDSPF
jgi:hypothetical protein